MLYQLSYLAPVNWKMEAEKTFEYIKGVCIDFRPTVLKHGRAGEPIAVFSNDFFAQPLASALPLPWVMWHLRLVKSDRNPNTSRRVRGSSTSAAAPLRRAKSTERRYRYPAEEIWKVSEDRWQVAESRYLPEEQAEGLRPKA